MHTIKNRLKEFKLSGIYNSIEERISYAKSNNMSYEEFMALILDDEIASRRDNSYKKRYLKTKLPNHKTLEDFDFAFQPSINKRLINDCATCSFIKEKKNVIFIGNPGTGKTHLSIALGLQALKKGYKVLFTQVSEMLHNLHISKADNSYYKKLEYYLSFDLLVLDELGFKKIPNHSGDDFFEIISRRYEKGSIIITTNKSFEQWGEIFTDQILANAILDRIVHYGEVIKISGQSYRQKNLKQNKK
ncbi:IS21-like element helper ATPase IstB [bacterium]